MIDTLTSTPFFGLGVTLLCWYLAVRFQKRTGLTTPAAALSNCCWLPPPPFWL